MASALWNELKKAPKRAPINVVNGDVLVIEETQGGDTVVKADTANVRAPATGERPRFKPVDPSTVADIAIEEPERKPDVPSDNFDLVGDDIGNPPSAKRNGSKAGRPRLYPNDAAKQAAYRARRNQQAQDG